MINTNIQKKWSLTKDLLIIFHRGADTVDTPKGRGRQRSKKATDGAKTKNNRVPKKEKPRKQHYDQIIFRDWCKACGICSAFCPKEVIGKDKKGAPVIERPDECIGCRFCELHCPDFAITVIERPEKGADLSS